MATKILGVLARIVELLMRVRRSIDDWGSGKTIDWAAPTLRDDAIARKRMGAVERAAMSPKMALLTWQANLQLPDLRGIAESVGVPTLVMHRREEAMPVEMGRDLAAAIPGARFVELEGVDHLPHVGDYKSVTGERLYRARVGSGGAFAASPVAADGRLYFAHVDGDVSIRPIGCWPPCCSRTSSTPRDGRQNSATNNGGICFSATMR